MKRFLLMVLFAAALLGPLASPALARIALQAKHADVHAAAATAAPGDGAPGAQDDQRPLAPAALPSAALASDDALPLPDVWPAALLEQLESPDYADLWTVDLKEGQQILANMTQANGNDVFGVCLWAPGTTDFSDPLGASLKSDISILFMRSLSYRYIVPTGAAGTYYIEAWWDQFYVLQDPSYQMWVSVQSPSKTAVRITPPAVPYVVHTSTDYESWGTLRPLHYAGNTSVKVVWQSYYRGRWVAEPSDHPENEDYFNGTSRFTRFQVSYSFMPLWGHGGQRWRVKAIHLADSLHPRKVSAWRYFNVAP
jgi:hypothetical protein